MKSRNCFVYAVAIVLFLVPAGSCTLLTGVFGPRTKEVEGINWAAIRDRDLAVTSEQWGTPELVELPSTPGWEEGTYIEPAGDTLYFIYTTVDVFRTDETTAYEIGPNLDPDMSCTHFLNPEPHSCGVYPRADHFFVTRESDGWSEPEPHPLTRTGPIGGIHLVVDDVAGKTYAYFMHGFEDDRHEIEDIGVAVKDHATGEWGERTKIDAVSSLEYADSDPWVNAANDEMFFWSDRPAEFGDNNIYRSVKVDGAWQAPELLSAPINSDGDDLQTFPHDGYLYYAQTPSEEGQGSIAIYRAQRLGDDEWGSPELVIYAPNGAVGEPSLTADGEYLYFEQIFTDGEGNFNPDTMVVRRAG